MTTRTEQTSRGTKDGETPLEEIAREFLTEVRLVPGVVLARVLFRTDDGAFSDAAGADLVEAGDAEHPVTEAAARGARVEGVWPGDGALGEAIPVGLPARSDVVAWIAFEDDTISDDRDFLVDRAIERLASRIRGAAGVWADERRQAALRCAFEASQRFHTETSLHRALRLSVTELADLAGAVEASVWKIDAPGEPVCIAHANARMTTPQHEEAVRRLVAEVQSSHGSVRVLDTTRSDHYGWCTAHGIRRFIAHPIRAFDALHGVLVIVNFKSAPVLVGSGLTPGVETAAGIVASSAAAAFHQVARDARATELEKELRGTRRQLERADRASARLDLARRAAEELDAALGELDDPELTTHDATRARHRAQDILAEFRALSVPSGARLRMTSINDSVHDAVKELRSRPDDVAINISVRLQGDLPKLLLDGEKIRAMLVNLIEYGVVGTERREAIVMSRLLKGEVVVELRFPERDIPSGVLDSLFLPFSEEDDAKGRLGLALADQIIGEHGGQLRARHEGEDGLCYWLSLPVSDNQERRRRRGDRRSTDRRRALGDAA